MPLTEQDLADRMAVIGDGDGAADVIAAILWETVEEQERAEAAKGDSEE
jgi:hypothetical protein